MAKYNPPLLAENFGPMGYANGEVYGNRRDESGAYNTYAIHVKTKVERSLSKGNVIYGQLNTHRGVSDVTADGKFMLVHVERGTPQSPNSYSEPGKGGACDVWLATTDGLKAWKLTNDYWGSFWARFNHTGDKFVYAEIIEPAWWPEYFGGEFITIHNIIWIDGFPGISAPLHLGDHSKYHEAYGWSPDGKNIVAVTDEPTPGDPMKAQIMHFPLDEGPPIRVTTALGNDYQEFAIQKPDGSGYVISSGYKGWINGTDRWLVKLSDPNAPAVRVTRFADWTTWWPQSGISGGMAFIDNHTACIGFTQNGVENAYIIDVP